MGMDLQLFQEMVVPQCNTAWSIKFDLVLMIWKDSDDFANSVPLAVELIFDNYYITIL